MRAKHSSQQQPLSQARRRRLTIATRESYYRLCAGDRLQDSAMSGDNPARPDRRRFVTSLAAMAVAAARGPSLLLRVGAPVPREHVVVVGAGAFGGWTAL